MTFPRLWWISLFVKFALAALLPLAADEAYYWIWSHHLQWSYYDHPPMVAALLWLGRPLENFGGMVRWPAILLAHASLFFWWKLLKNRLTPIALERWMLLALLTPLIGFGSLVVTPDLPLLFFWSLSLYCYDRALTTRDLNWYAALGLSLGLGFTSKYHIVFLVPVFLLHLTFEKEWSRVRFPALLLVVFTGLLGSAPVLFWNATNDWQSFRFQLEHGLGRDSWNPSWTVSYLLGQVVLLGPWLIPSFLKATKNQSLRLFFWNAVFIWGFFAYSSFHGVVEANWPIVAFPAAFALVASALPSRRIFVGTIVFWSILGTIVATHWIFNWIPGLPENLEETRQYRKLAPFVEKYQPLYANTYQMASILSFETKSPVFKLNDMSRFDFFDQLPESFPAPGPYFLVKREGQNLPKWVREGHNRIEAVEKSAPNFEVLRITPESP